MFKQVLAVLAIGLAVLSNAQAQTQASPQNAQQQRVPPSQVAQNRRNPGALVPGTPAQAQTVVVPKGTVLKLSTVQPLDSTTARPGDDVPLRLSRPLVVSGVTLLREGDVLHGRVTRVRHAGRHCHSGWVEWKIDRVAFDDHTTAQSTMYYPPRNLEVPEYAEVTGMNGLSGGRRIGFYVLSGVIFVPALPLITAQAALFSAPPFSHSSDHADCTTPGQEFQLPAETTIAVQILRSHHVRF